MRKKIISSLSLILTMIIAVYSLPVYSTDELIMHFDLEPDPQQSTEYTLGDVVTLKVSLTENCGLASGTLYFVADQGLEFVSATFLGEQLDFENDTYRGKHGIVFISDDFQGDGDGKIGISIIASEEEIFTETSDDYCEISFLINSLEESTVSMYLFDGIAGDDNHSRISSNECSYTLYVVPPERPVIVKNDIPDAVMGQPFTYSFGVEDESLSGYISWQIIDGELPKGISLLNDGTLSGTPDEFGNFSFTVKSVIRDEIESEPYVFDLVVLEKPLKLELIDESELIINSETSFLQKVTDKVSAETLIDNFKNKDFVKVFDRNGSEMASTATVGTGCTVSLMNGGEKIDTVTVIVLGDISGDGRIGTIDYQLIRAFYLNTRTPNDYEFAAATVSGSNRIGTIDYQRVRAHYLNTYNIFN